MVKRRWFRSYAPHELPKFDYIFQSWDTANKSAEINDYSVCTTWGLADKQHLYLLDVLRARFEYPELKRTIVRHARIHAAKSVVMQNHTSITYDSRVGSIAGGGIPVYRSTRKWTECTSTPTGTAVDSGC